MNDHFSDFSYLEDTTTQSPIALPYPDGMFNCVEFDFPWAYDRSPDDGGKGFAGWFNVQEYRIMTPYPNMSLSEVNACGKEILRVATPWAHFWMWTTKDFLLDSQLLLKKWGILQKQVFVWRKTTKEGRPIRGGMGYWGRNALEFLIFGVLTTKGTRPLAATTESNYFDAPGEEIIHKVLRQDPCIDAPRQKGPNGRYHSVKPDEAYRVISRNSLGPRLSIFQTKDREGFDYYYGNEMPTYEKVRTEE